MKRLRKTRCEALFLRISCLYVTFSFLFFSVLFCSFLLTYQYFSFPPPPSLDWPITPECIWRVWRLLSEKRKNAHWIKQSWKRLQQVCTTLFILMTFHLDHKTCKKGSGSKLGFLFKIQRQTKTSISALGIPLWIQKAFYFNPFSRDMF